MNFIELYNISKTNQKKNRNISLYKDMEINIETGRSTVINYHSYWYQYFTYIKPDLS